MHYSLQDSTKVCSSLPHRIALLHLDSLNCLPALDRLFAALGGRICVVVSSDRFAGMAGFWRQFTQNLSHSGMRMTFALGFDIVALHIAGLFAPTFRRFGHGHQALHTVREHARRVGAQYLIVRDINSVATVAAFQRLKPDLIVSFHFDQILQPSFLQALSAPVLNVHPALLPAHRGPCPSFWVLAAGETGSGVTIHRITDASIDTGEPVARRERCIRPRLSVAELDELLFEEGADLLANLLATGQFPWISSRPDKTEVASPLPYESFPDRQVVSAARRRGVRLWRLKHAVRLLVRLFGWRRA